MKLLLLSDLLMENTLIQIGKVAGAGTTQTIQNYEFKDVTVREH
ncbi:MAG: hypothetical protein R2879_14760 [Saprospiraceae bacterium]